MDSSTFPTPKRRIQPLLSPSSSFSSSSSSLGFSSAHSSPQRSPSSPIQSSHRVPFSWEKLPGIPKKQTLPRKQGGTVPNHHHRHGRYSFEELLLPPPPPAGASKRFDAPNGALRGGWKGFGESARMDPFFAAMVECSKDDEDGGGGERDPLRGRVWKPRSSSDLFGSFLNLNVSCKRACAVSESIVYLPKQIPNNPPAARASVGPRRR